MLLQLAQAAHVLFPMAFTRTCLSQVLDIFRQLSIKVVPVTIKIAAPAKAALNVILGESWEHKSLLAAQHVLALHFALSCNMGWQCRGGGGCPL